MLRCQTEPQPIPVVLADCRKDVLSSGSLIVDESDGYWDANANFDNARRPFVMRLDYLLFAFDIVLDASEYSHHFRRPSPSVGDKRGGADCRGQRR